jgi:imidazolonepropionase-like amidohydrolase
MSSPDHARRLFASAARLGSQLDLERDVMLEVDDTGRLIGVCSGASPRGARRLEGVVLPGLIDAHVHLSMNGGADVVEELRTTPVPVLAARALANATAQLRGGVTTVRDLGSPDDLVVSLAAEPLDMQLPRLIAAGVVAATGGHGAFLGRTADGPQAVRRAVREVAATGARWVKVFASGGVVTPQSATNVQQWFPDELSEAVRTARSLGLRVAAHAHSHASILAAIAAEVDSVEHCSATDTEVIAAFAASGSVPVSTLVATERFTASDAIASSRPDVVAKIHAHAPGERAALRELVASELDLVAATDAGTTHNPHGHGLAEQAALLVDAGASPLRAVQAITVRAGELLDVAAGRIEAGARADLAVFATDPCDDLAALATPLEVVLGGATVTA